MVNTEWLRKLDQLKNLVSKYDIDPAEFLQGIEEVHKAFHSRLEEVKAEYESRASVQEFEKVKRENLQLKYNMDAQVDDYEEQLKEIKEELKRVRSYNTELNKQNRLLENLVFNQAEFMTNYKKQQEENY
jgi:TolA-binding protein